MKRYSSESIAQATAAHVQTRRIEQNALLLSACKAAYENLLHPGTVVGQALLEAIRSCEPGFPERAVRR